MKTKIKKRVVALFLVFLLGAWQPFVTYVYSETTESITAAVVAEEESVANDNEATVENNTNVEANTGENVVITPSPTVVPEEVIEEAATLTPTPTLLPEISSEPEPTPTEAIVIADEVITPTPTLVPDAEALNTEITEIDNQNDAEVTNEATVSAETGAEKLIGDEADLTTGDATAEADLANVVNTNIVGNDFWETVVNVFSPLEGEIDLSSPEVQQSLDPQIVSTIALSTGKSSESVSFALANFISLVSIYNQNTGTLTNNIDLSALTGGNLLVGDNGQVTTGDAKTDLNLFNLVNTNLIGQNWFFGILNLFASVNGNIILPYEFDFLDEDSHGSTGGSALSISDGGQAVSSATDSFSVNNLNQATIVNNVDVTANSGENQIVGSGIFDTGNAGASLDLLNLVNTNITGSRWVLVMVNNFGDWVGEIVDWWGKKFVLGKTTFLWVKLPSIESSSSGTAVSQGDLAQSTAINSTSVGNSNLADVENNISLLSDTGNNEIEGENGSIKTGNANASADIFNMVNTNITGRNWYFAVINIFDNFLGNIIFPRADLRLTKTASKTSVVRGEELSYTLRIENIGRTTAKNVNIVDSLPAGLTFVFASSGGVYQDGQVKWVIPSLSPLTGTVLTINVLVNNKGDLGKLINFAECSSATAETKTGDNQSMAEVEIIPADTGGNQDQPDEPQTQGSSSSTTGNDSNNGSDGGGSSAALAVYASGNDGQDEGVLGESWSGESEEGEVAGALKDNKFPWWILILILITTVAGFIFNKVKKTRKLKG